MAVLLLLHTFLIYTDLYDLAFTVVQKLDIIIVAFCIDLSLYSMYNTQKNFAGIRKVRYETNVILLTLASVYFHSVQMG